MIPKVIHYCWFGGNPINKLGKKCIESWKKYFPEYEIIQWNENNFDINCCKYVREAYDAKKWAFVSDYARFKILYDIGGVYFDTDVEVIKKFDDIIRKGNFMGAETNEQDIAVAPGLGMAFAPGNNIIKEILEDYKRSSFIREDGSYDLTTVVERTTKILKKYGLKDISEIQTVADINIYPMDYFCPIDKMTGKIAITKNTHSIHRFSRSWVSKSSKIKGKIYRILTRCFGKHIADAIRNAFGKKRDSENRM